jgi:hypothetical protein
MTGRRGNGWFELCLLCCIAWASPSSAAERTAFYYGRHVPSDLIAAYDQVVVEPDHLPDLKAFEGQPARPVAYLSIGEVARATEQAKRVDPSWVISENRAWSSLVMDLSSPGYQAWLLERFEALWARGYRGFFLDTLDSYRLAAPERRGQRQRQGLIEIIQGLARRHPSARLLVNRGFEVLPDVKGMLSGVVAESLFDRYDAATQSYRRVPESDRRWLTTELTRARDEHGLPVTVIDYRPEAERPQARETARKIAALGFEPWVTNGALDAVGVGSLEILPRRVLILTNDAALGTPDALRFLAPVLEYLGYVPEHRRVPSDWAELGLEQGYQGVITWFSGSALPPGYTDWMSVQRRRGIRFVLFGVPGFDVAGPAGRALGLSLVASASTSAARVVQRDGLVGFEAEPPLRPFDGPLVRLVDAPGTAVHLRLEDEKGQSGIAVATTAWGGFALSHALALRGLAGERAWVIDPFAFLRRSLSLPDAPMPNVTTRNGRRLGMILVRPEGLAGLAGHRGPSSARALGEWLAAHHAWPHSLAMSPSDPATPISAADEAAAQNLLQRGFFERAELRPGTTRARGDAASLTLVSGFFAGGERSMQAELVGPIALDSAFLTSGGPQAYPYRDVLRTLRFTETPRRLTPVLVDYHGYLLASPGGRATLAAIYAELERGQLFPVYVSEYATLVRAFGEQVVARALDGSFHYFGGEPLRTVRSPLALGWPLSAGASGAAAVRRGPDGLYSSFLPEGPRRLTLGSDSMGVPHVAQANGRVLAFDAVGPYAAGAGRGPTSGGERELVRLELAGHVPLELELEGLPRSSPCELRFGRSSAPGVTSEQGSLRLSLDVMATGAARLVCRSVPGGGAPGDGAPDNGLSAMDGALDNG